MIKAIGALVFCFFAAFASGQELPTGFYMLTAEKTKGCPNVITTINGKQSFCVTNKPVLDTLGFEGVSEIRFAMDKKTRYVDLKISSKGAKLLATVMTSLPDTKLLLVIESKVVGIFNNSEITSLRGQLIRINGDPASPEIDWIYNNLKRVKK